MTTRLDEHLSRYGDYLDSLLMEVEPEQATDRVASRSEQPLPEDAATPTWRRGLVVAVGTAAAVLALVGAIILLAGPFGSEEPVPPATEPPQVVTTMPGVDEPRELAPTDVHLLTEPSSYQFVARDHSGDVWFSGYEGQVAWLDPATGETRVWTVGDDATFRPGIQGLAPARGGGVWMLLGDNSLRRFDGERFVDVVEAPAMVSDRDDLGSVVETADGRLLATTAQGGLFLWDGSSWSNIDGARPATGAAALAVDGDGIFWIGNDNIGGIARFDGETWTAYSTDDAAVLATPVRTIEPLPNGTVWVGTESGVARFDGDSWSSWTQGEIGLRGDISVSVGPDGAVWAAGGSEFNGGVRVARFDGDAWFSYGPEHGLPGEAPLIVAVPIATEDGVFVATSVGVYQLGGDLWTRVLSLEEQAFPAEPPAALAGVRDVKAAGGFLWAWGEDEIWRYGDGAWEFYAPTSEAPGDLAYDGTTLWALDERLVYLDGEEWHELTGAPAQVWRIDADPNTEVLWLSTGERLFRWDGAELTDVGFPPNYPPDYPSPSESDHAGYVGDVVVTADGKVWAAGLYGYSPWLGGLAVYDDGLGSWRTVRPWLSDRDIPAQSLMTTPDGGLWVMLSEWSEDWWDSNTSPPGWALAHRDPATDDWTIYDQELPDAHPLAMAATNDAVWLAQGGALVEGTRPIQGIFQFDGVTWTQHSSDEALSLAAASDGTVWYLTETGVLDQIGP